MFMIEERDEEGEEDTRENGTAENLKITAISNEGSKKLKIRTS